MTTLDSEFPERFYTKGRIVDQAFDDEEILYRRCPKSEVLDEQPHIEQIPFYPDLSVNRQRYSYPADVLYRGHFGNFGVLAFRVCAIPPEISGDGENAYSWRPVHVPEEENYAHSEVRTYKNNAPFDEKLRIKNQRIKKEFREYLEDRSRIVIQPGAGNPTDTLDESCNRDVPDCSYSSLPAEADD